MLFSKISTGYFQFPSVDASVLDPTRNAFSLLFAFLNGLIGAGSRISNTLTLYQPVFSILSAKNSNCFPPEPGTTGNKSILKSGNFAGENKESATATDPIVS